MYVHLSPLVSKLVLSIDIFSRNCIRVRKIQHRVNTSPGPAGLVHSNVRYQEQLQQQHQQKQHALDALLGGVLRMASRACRTVAAASW